MKMNRTSILKISTVLEAVEPPSVFSYLTIARENGPVLNISKSKEKYTLQFWNIEKKNDILQKLGHFNPFE